jgi:hypothetical protein
MKGLLWTLGAGAIGMATLAGMVDAQTPAPSQPTMPRQPAPENAQSAADALAKAPKAMISNGVLHATVLLPDARAGFYRNSRFDWSGVISSLTLGSQEYYGLWFDKTAANIRDYVFDQGRIVAGPNTAIMGPSEAFDADDPPGWAEAKPGETFLKIGVGMLRKPTDGANYSSFRVYDIVNGGAWKVRRKPDSVEFTQTLSDPASGYGYIYRKTVRLVPGAPEMVLEHSFTNSGRKPIRTTVFNHNFLTFGGRPTVPGLTVQAAFPIAAGRPARSDAAAIVDGKVVYSRALADGEAYFFPVTGFGASAADNRVTVSTAHGASVTITGDQPLASFALWSIRETVAPEPFVTISTGPGETRRWKYEYRYAAPNP